MGEDIKYGGFLFFKDGEKLGEWNVLKDVQFFCDEDAKNDSAGIIDFSKEISLEASFKVSQRVKNWIFYGWRAKGPVRKRLLRRMIQHVYQGSAF